MKKTLHKLLLIGAIVAILPSCEFLSIEEPGQNDIPKFYSNIEGLRFGRAGMYRELYEFFDSYYTKYAEVAADLVQVNTGQDMFNQFNYISLPEDDGTAVQAIWDEGYSAIGNINLILQYAPSIKEEYPETTAEVDRIRAEAMFARALMYLALCNTYAQQYNYTSGASHPGVPAITRLAGSNEEIGRNTVREVYARITDDLSAALSILGEPAAVPAASDWSYYATAHACKALQARVYLYMGNNEAARGSASVLIDNMTLTPYSDYAAMCQSDSDAEPGVESIFKLSGLGNNGHAINSFFYNRSSVAPAGPSNKLLDMFQDPGDVRASLIDQGVIVKYRSPLYLGQTPPDANLIPYAIPILRLSEMYLIRAEAYYNSGQYDLAVKDLQAIIGRATDTAPASVTVTYGSPDELFDIIERERCLEFFGEGHRLFDILRWKQSLERDEESPVNSESVRKIAYPSNKFVLPIPYKETSVNGAIVQNPGY